MAKQADVRLQDVLANQAEDVARVGGISSNGPIVESLATDLESVRASEEFTTQARKLLARDKELPDRLAK